MPINSFLYPAKNVPVVYEVANSVRFNRGDSAYLQKSASAGNRKTFTFSTWLKRGNLTYGYATFFSSDQATDNSFRVTFDDDDGSNDDHLMVYYYTGSHQLKFITNREFRDVSAWYHIVIAVDTTQSTEANRFKIYVNGTQETSFATDSYPSQNLDTSVNQSGAPTRVGAGTSLYFDGYMAETVLIDGTQYAASDFGEFDSDSPTIWKPKDVSGLTFGTNGFYLDFEDSSNLGNDANGGTDLTATNLAATDQSTDTCTNNFSTMNPLDVPASNQPTFSEGNLKVVSPSASGDNNFGGASTFAVSSGKWYIEAKATVGAGGYSRNRIGITGNESTARINNTLGANSYEYFYDSEAGNSNAGSYGNSYTTGDIIGIALNLDDNELKFYKNGTVQNSGTAISITAPASTSIGGYKIAQSDSSGLSNTTATYEFNFGSPSFAISSGNADGNGYGNFEYSVPSGYYSLCTKNLAEYGG